MIRIDGTAKSHVQSVLGKDRTALIVQTAGTDFHIINGRDFTLLVVDAASADVRGVGVNGTTLVRDAARSNVRYTLCCCDGAFFATGIIAQYTL